MRTTYGRTSLLTRSRVTFGVVVVALLVAMGLSTTWWPVDKPVPGQRQEFDAAQWAKDNYESKIVPAITDNAVDVSTLVPLLQQDADAAGEQYGQRDGSSPYTFPVTVTGTAGEVAAGLLPLKVEGLPEDARVAIQVGPAINGTALRDSTGLVKFNDFVNQVEYANTATALNDLMKEKVLAELDPAALAGKTVTVVGATSPLNPTTLTLTAVSIEVAP